MENMNEKDLEKQRKICEQIKERWDKLGFTEGLKKNDEFESLMELFEAQARVLVEEAKNK